MNTSVQEHISPRERFLSGEPFVQYDDTIYKYLPASREGSDPILLIKREGYENLTGFCYAFDITDSGYQIEIDAYLDGPTVRWDVDFDSLTFVSPQKQTEFNAAIASCIEATFSFHNSLNSKIARPFLTDR